MNSICITLKLEIHVRNKKNWIIGYDINENVLIGKSKIQGKREFGEKYVKLKNFESEKWVIKNAW
jgi:hypothetical protein